MISQRNPPDVKYGLVTGENMDTTSPNHNLTTSRKKKQRQKRSRFFRRLDIKEVRVHT